MLLAFIEWGVSPEVFHSGPVSVRLVWFSICNGFCCRIFYNDMGFKKENRPQTDLEQLSVYMIFGTVIGARLGHCLFYNPSYYLSNPIEILKVWEGGLASHGACNWNNYCHLYFFKQEKKLLNALGT